MQHTHLVKKAKKGNKEALLQLIMKEKDAYYRLAYAYMGNEHDALDVMEDMIVKLYEKIDQLKKPESFYSWSKTILVNLCKTMLKRQQRIVLIDDLQRHPSITEADNYSESITSSDNQMDINQLLAKLNDQQREAIQLRYFHDLDYQSIASITNVSLGTVKSRIFQGLKKLKFLYRGGDANA